MSDKKEHFSENYIRRLVREELEKRDELYKNIHNIISDMRTSIKEKSKKYLSEDTQENEKLLEAELKVLKNYLDRLNEEIFDNKGES